MIGQDLGVGVVTEAPEQRRRSFDVGEEESECVRGPRLRDRPEHGDHMNPGRAIT
jgi:hypothetical protein